MRILFIHQTIPGQFPHLARKLAEDPRNEVYFLTRIRGGNVANVVTVRYNLRPQPKGGTHPYLQNLQNGVVYGEAVARAVLDLEKHRNFRPDIIYAHPGWGECLFLKDVLPDVPLIHYCEFFYRAHGADSFFGTEETPTLAEEQKIRTKNAVNYISLDICDRAVTPTRWQLRQHPPQYHSKIAVIHDGIDTDLVRPDANATFTLPDGRVVRAGDEVVTHVNRTLEPFRGLLTFAEAARIIASKRPNCQFLVVGKETGRYYGRAPEKGSKYSETALQLLAPIRDRVHMLGMLPYGDYLRVLQVSAAHIYLTRPFVLSWSMLEAMAAGCVVVGSATPPVAEVIDDDVNGLMADFFSPEEVAERVLEALEDRRRMQDIRAAARQTVVERYALSRCLPAQIDLIRSTLAERSVPGTVAA